MSPRKTIFINSHPIQYFAPMYRYLNEHGIPTECWYCSDENVKGHLDRQFGTQVEWDIPILQGYTHRFFRNHSWKPSLYNGFFGLINFGMVRALFREKKSTIIVHGWSYLTHVLVVIFGRMAGHRVCMRGENPLNQEMKKGFFLRAIKRIVFQGFLFWFPNRFLYIGKENKAFYRYYGVPEKQLVFTPYAVDNDRFQEAAAALVPRKHELRGKLRIPAGGKVILFAAKFIEKKRPMDLLKAYQLLKLDGKCLVMVGDGALRAALEHYIIEEQVPNVILAGFVNQSEITEYYAAADVFVLCSGEGETWGLSVNEAMNFNLPVVVSRTAGCAADLVREDMGGYPVEEGNVEALSKQLAAAIEKNNVCRSKEVISLYSYESMVNAIAEVGGAGTQ